MATTWHWQFAASSDGPHVQPAAEQAVAATRPKVDRENDLRNPRKRLEAFFDQGTLELITAEDTSGMLCATGKVRGTPVVAFVSDATIQGGAMGKDGCKAIPVAYERALVAGVPILGIWHSGGARLAEGVVSLHAVGEVFAIMTRASGKIPQISIVIGPAAGGAAYGPALTDIVILGPDGPIFVTGPDVVRSVTGENVDALRLGGPEPHGRRLGVVHVVTETTEAAYERGQQLCSLLGDQGRLDVSSVQERDLAGTFPGSARRVYDVHPLIDNVLDDAEHSVELHPKWAPNIATTLGRFGGRTVGVVANNPMRLGGCLDSAPADKAARFVRMCDAFSIPLIVLVDVPGYLPGVGQEWDGVVRRGAKLLHAFAEATVPPGHPSDPQVVWRCVYRHERPMPRCNKGIRVADGHRCRDGRSRGCASFIVVGSPRSPKRTAPRSRTSWPSKTKLSPADCHEPSR